MTSRGRVYKRCNGCSRASQLDAGRKCQHNCSAAARIKWAITFDLPPINGRRRRQTRSGFSTKQEAEEALSEELQRLQRSSAALVRPKLTLGEYLDEWIEGRRLQLGSSLRESTWRENSRHIERYIKPRIGSMRLLELDRATVKRWARNLKAELHLAPGTVLNALGTLSKALQDAIDDEILDRNVAKGAWRVKPGDRKRAKPFSQDEMRRFLGQIDDDRLVALWRLLVTVGCRRSEALGLDWRHVDLDQGIVTFEQGYVSGIRGHLLQPTKTGRVRRVRLERGTLDALIRLYQITVSQFLELNLDTGSLPTTPVFRSLTGKRLNPDGVSATWRKLCVKAGVPVIRLHDARHSVATALLDRKVPIHQVSILLGHSTPATTHSTYSHVIDALDPSITNTMEEIVRSEA